MKNSSKPRFELKGAKSIKHKENKINLRKIQNHSGRGIVQEPCQGQPQSSEILKTKGYHIIPINPFAEVILGEACPKSLLEVPGTIEIVDIFRSAKDVPPIVDQAIELTKKLGNPTVIWMQLGIVGEKAARCMQQGRPV